MIVSPLALLLTPQGYAKPSTLTRKDRTELVTGTGYKAVRLTQLKQRDTFLRLFFDNGATMVIHEDDGVITRGGLYTSANDLSLGDRVRMTVVNIQNYYGWRKRDFNKATSRATDENSSPILTEDISWLLERGVGFKRGFVMAMMETSYTSVGQGQLRINLKEDKQAETLYTLFSEFGVVSELETRSTSRRSYCRVLADLDMINQNIAPEGKSSRSEINGTAQLIDLEPFDSASYQLEANLDSVIFNNTFHQIVSNDK